MTIDNARDLIGQPESVRLEYKFTLPPVSGLARLIAAFANTDGGLLIIGVKEGVDGPEVVGLSRDVPAQSAVEAALVRLSPRPAACHGMTVASGKDIYVVEVEKSAEVILAEDGRVFRRLGEHVREVRPPEAAAPGLSVSRTSLPPSLKELLDKIKAAGTGATEAQLTMLRQYQRLVDILVQTRDLVCAEKAEVPPKIEHGRALTRLAFSSLVDSFERYLSDLLIEVHYAKPDTLKSEAPFLAKDILDCANMTEVIALIANKRVGSLQRGSADDFVKYIKKTFNVDLFLRNEGASASFASGVRNLYVHSNGVVDEKFLRQTGVASLKAGDEHSTSVQELCKTATFYLDVAKRLDQHAVQVFGLSTDSFVP